eukprot:1699028-Rhodomonas_salina.5
MAVPASLVAEMGDEPIFDHEWYRPTDALCDVRGIGLRVRYALSSTDLGYAATSEKFRLTIIRYYSLFVPRFLYGPTGSLSAARYQRRGCCYGSTAQMPGTDPGHAAMPFSAVTLRRLEERDATPVRAAVGADACDGWS